MINFITALSRRAWRILWGSLAAFTCIYHLIDYLIISVILRWCNEYNAQRTYTAQAHFLDTPRSLEEKNPKLHSTHHVLHNIHRGKCRSRRAPVLLDRCSAQQMSVTASSMTVIVVMTDDYVAVMDDNYYSILNYNIEQYTSNNVTVW